MGYQYHISMPEYITLCYRPLLEVFSEAGEEIEKAGRPSYGFRYAKDAVRVLNIKQVPSALLNFCPF